ncbi:MAG: DNA repair protein RecO [Candidatus Limimorpha sp.]
MDTTDKTRAIALKGIRYGESSLIVKLLTEDIGLQSFIIKGALKKGSRIRSALFQPLTLLSIVRSKSKGELAYLKEVGVEYTYQNIPFNINKNTIVLFICELLSKSIQESEKDVELFNFIYDSLIHLDKAETNYVDFPLKFAIELSRYLGFAPNTNDYKEGYVFDLNEGSYCRNAMGIVFPIEGECNKIFKELCNTNIFDDISLNIRNDVRRKLLEYVITYYKLHVNGFNDMNSNEILRTILQ